MANLDPDQSNEAAAEMTARFEQQWVEERIDELSGITDRDGFWNNLGRGAYSSQAYGEAESMLANARGDRSLSPGSEACRAVEAGQKVGPPIGAAAAMGVVGKATAKCPPKGKHFTRAQKKKYLDANRAKNGGELRSDMSGRPLVPSKQSQKGVTPSPDEAQVDHKLARSRGGQNTDDNAQILSRKENNDKSDK